jgi:hypothetical protein
MVHGNNGQANRRPVVKKIRLTPRDMVELCSEFVVRDW